MKDIYKSKNNSGDSMGRKLKIRLFGRSHSKEIGISISGLPKGLQIDKKCIQSDLNRRRPGQNKISTQRNEKDLFKITDGLKNGKTTGKTLRLIILNTDIKSKDYSLFREIHRPSHVDYPAILRYGPYVDIRGSGKFSGRLTAPIVAAGAIAKKILSKKNIKIAGFTSQIGDILDSGDYSVEKILKNVEKNIVRAVNSDSIAKSMINLIEKVKKEKDSIGGVVTIKVENFPPGIGDPWFHSLESDIASAIMSIPGIRGIEFGSGFQAASMSGSEHNDPYILKDGKISTKTNNCGGIIGGISLGTPIYFKVAVKPTASIGRIQKTLNFKTKEITELKIGGRHDPCIVPRALVALEAITAIVLADHLLISKNYNK